MSKAREGGSKEWAKHLRKDGKRANNKGERAHSKRKTQEVDHKADGEDDGALDATYCEMKGKITGDE